METIIIGSSEQNKKKVLIGFIWQDTTFCGYMEPGNYYSGYLDLVNNYKYILSYLGENGKKLVIERKKVGYETMLGTTKYCEPYAEGTDFICDYKAFGENYETSLSNDEALRGQREIKPPMVYKKSPWWQLTRK